jgi:hypothetical protein
VIYCMVTDFLLQSMVRIKLTSSGKASDFYVGDLDFESRPERRLSWGSSTAIGKCWASISHYATIVIFHNFSNSLFTSNPTIRSNIIWVSDGVIT